MTGQKSGNIMLRQPLHSSMTQTWANILCFKQEQWRIHTGANMAVLLKKASRNGRSGNMAVAAEQGRFQHVKAYTHMLNLTSLHLSECSMCTKCQSYRGGADVLLNFAKEKHMEAPGAYKLIKKFPHQRSLSYGEERRRESVLGTQWSRRHTCRTSLRPKKDAITLYSEQSTLTISIQGDTCWMENRY